MLVVGIKVGSCSKTYVASVSTFGVVTPLSHGLTNTLMPVKEHSAKLKGQLFLIGRGVDEDSGG